MFGLKALSKPKPHVHPSALSHVKNKSLRTLSFYSSSCVALPLETVCCLQLLSVAHSIAHNCSLQLCCTQLQHSPPNVALSLNYIFALLGCLYSFLLVPLCTQHIFLSLSLSLFLSLLHMLQPTRRQGMPELPPTNSIGT
jgi:hypothetical protein